MVEAAKERKWARLLLLVVVLAIAIWVVRNSVQRVVATRQVAELCQQARDGQFEAALRSSEASPTDTDALAAERLECRCMALSGLGREQQCRAELAEVLVEGGEGPLGNDRILRSGVDHLLEDGRFEQAWDVIERARASRGDPDLLQGREFQARLELESEDEVLRDFSRRLSEGRVPLDVPIMMASRDLELGRVERALQFLGDTPPAAPDEVRRLWFGLRSGAAALAGDLPGVTRTLEEWRENGLSEAEFRARRALLASNFSLLPSTQQLQLLQQAIASEDAQPDEDVAVAVRSRTIRVLAARGDYEQATTLFDSSIEKYGRLQSLDREELRRLELERRVSERDDQPRTASVTFRGLDSGDVVVISVPTSEPPSAPLQRHRAAGRSVVLQRPSESRPAWWVVEDAQQAVRAMGTVWFSGAPKEVQVQRREPLAQRTSTAAPEPADGQRRVYQVVLDSADWRIIRALIARGRAPVFEHLERLGTSAVIYSEPPYTAAALKSLTSPADRQFGLVELAFQLGEEVQALDFVGHNPAQFLAPLVAQQPDLFETLGGGQARALNLLHAIGSIEAGRNARVIGPDGAVEDLMGLVGRRALSAEEVAAIAGVERDLAEDRSLYYENAAGDFDVLLDVIRQRQIDFVSTRIASLDLITHGTFGSLADERQHDGDVSLLRFYEYLDLRLGEVLQAIDGDDVLMVLSDHGTLTSFKHDEDSYFVAVGPPFEPGRRLESKPRISGVSWLVAQVLGAEVDWPEHGAGELLAPRDLD